MKLPANTQQTDKWKQAFQSNTDHP